MSFEAREESVDAGTPVSLYLFRYNNGADNYFAYTDHTASITHDSVDYEPETVGRGSIEDSGSFERKTLDIQINTTCGLADLLRLGSQPGQISVTIYQGHVDDPDSEFLVVWSGRLLSSVRRGPRLELKADSIATALKGPVPRRYYQVGCPWVLYGPGCQASRVVKKRSSTVQGLGENFVDLPSGWEGIYPPGKYAGGYLDWQSEDDGSVQTKTIMRVIGGGNRLVIRKPIIGLEVGTIINMYPGCNHTRADCEDIHSNLVNYGGQLYIPIENPVDRVNRWY